MTDAKFQHASKGKHDGPSGDDPNVTLVHIHDLVNPESGKTWKQENLAKTHGIPIGSLVEVKGDGAIQDDDGIRLYVVGHVRDCDGTPLYRLGLKDADWDCSWKPGFFMPNTFGNYSEAFLQVIRTPHNYNAGYSTSTNERN